MKISFRMSKDKLKSKIFLNEMYLGHVYLDVWTYKWSMNPNFRLPFNFTDVKKDKFESSYKAGKAMVDLYNFLFPLVDEEKDTQEFGISLSQMLMF